MFTAWNTYQWFWLKTSVQLMAYRLLRPQAITGTVADLSLVDFHEYI